MVGRKISSVPFTTFTHECVEKHFYNIIYYMHFFFFFLGFFEVRVSDGRSKTPAIKCEIGLTVVILDI